MVYETSYRPYVPKVDRFRHSRWLAAAAFLILFSTLIAFVWPPGRMSAVWGTGHKGATGALMGLFCRSYHHAPARVENLLPVRYRDGGSGREHYASLFVWPYLGYALVTSFTGVSEAALRGIAVAICLAGGGLLLILLRRREPPMAVCALALYASSPLTLLYGGMAEVFLLMGMALMLASWAYGEHVAGNIGRAGLVVLSIPLAMTSSFLPPFFVASVFAAHRMISRSWRQSASLALMISLPWAFFFAVHLGIVDAALGSVEPFFARGAERGLLSALREGDFLKGLWKAWFERLGAPVLVLAVASLVRIWPRRRYHPRRFAVALVGLGSAALFTLAMLQMVSKHDYAMQLFLPVLVLAGAPTLSDLLRHASFRFRMLGVLLLLVCAGLFVHRLNRRSGPDEYEKTLAAFAREAGAWAGPQGGRVLFLVDKNVMGAHTSVQFYSGVMVNRINRNERTPFNPRDYDAIIATEIPDAVPMLSNAYSLSREDFREREGLVLWLNPANRGRSAPQLINESASPGE